jgi:hypothetical protein
MRSQFKFALALVAGVLATPVTAQTASRADLEAYLNTQVANWVRETSLVSAVKEQNEAHSRYTQAHLEALDMIWRGEAVLGQGGIVDEVLSHPLSSGLQGKVMFSGGKVIEVFVMDNKGLNVGSTGMTSDYWQGDEAKFQQTFGRGAGSIHIGDIEFDDSANRYIAQLSMTVVDPQTGQAIGAITVGVDASKF